MKKVILSFISAVALTFTANATVITVSNNENSPGQYTTIQAAHDAAQEGDTLYIHASPNMYDLTSSVIIAIKRLVYIGEGALPDKQNKYSTTIGSQLDLRGSQDGTTSAAGSVFYGLNFYNSLAIEEVSNVSISYCKLTISSGTKTSGLLVTNSIIGFGSGKCTNSFFSNNIITALGLEDYSTYNVFVNNIINAGDPKGGNHALYANNIFYYNAGFPSTGLTHENMTFTNNLFHYNGNPMNSNHISGTNTGSGNLFQIDPEFEYGAPINGGFNGGFNGYNYTYPGVSGPFVNYNLQATSPCKNYGTDGTDLGIYGGSYPWQDASEDDSRFRYFRMPDMVPHMMKMTINNTAIPENGTLNVQFEAKTIE